MKGRLAAQSLVFLDRRATRAHDWPMRLAGKTVRPHTEARVIELGTISAHMKTALGEGYTCLEHRLVCAAVQALMVSSAFGYLFAVVLVGPFCPSVPVCLLLAAVLACVRTRFSSAALFALT